MRTHYFASHFRSCPFCGKTRRAGYIYACPECSGFLPELKRHLEGLLKYLEHTGYSLSSHLTRTHLYMCLRVGVLGFIHSIDSWLSLEDIHASSLPIEEILSGEICRMCKQLVGPTEHIPSQAILPLAR